MPESDRNSYNILVVAEINGAKKYMYEDGLIGLAHYLKNVQGQDKPNMFVLNGGLLPEFPLNRGGPRNDDKKSVVVDGVRNLEGAAAVMKPHMERLLSALPDDADFVYVMGKADLKNIEDIKLKYAKLYSTALGKIKQRDSQNLISEHLEKIKFELETNETLIAGLKNGVAGLRRRIEDPNDPGDKNVLRSDLEKERTKLRLNEEQHIEIKERRALFELLEQLIYSELPKDKVKQLRDEARARYQEVDRQLDELSSDSEEYLRLGKEKIALEKTVKALTKRYDERFDGDAAKHEMAKLGRMHRWTGNIPTPKDVNDTVTQLARLEYMTTLKDALGRKRPVIIQEKSLEVYQRSSGEFNFNVIVTDGLNINSSVYKKAGNTSLVRTAHIVTTNLGGDVRKTVNEAPLNVLVGGRSMFTSFSIDPWEDQSRTMVATLSKGPFLSTEQNTLHYLTKTKTDETQVAQRSVLDTSVSMVQVRSDGGVVHHTIKPGALNDERVKADREEAEALDGLIERFNGEKRKDEGGHDPELARAIIKSRRPSEVRDEELAYANERLLRSLAPHAAEAAPDAPQTIRIVEETDTHIGSWGSLEMLKASAKDAMKLKPDILVLDGDNIEGNLHNYKYTERAESNVNVIAEYTEWLRAKGLPEEQVNRELLETMNRLRSSVISNIDSQPKVFVGALQDLIVDVIERGGYVVVISGNHYNKTHADSQHDEATIISAHIEMLLEGVGKSGGLPEDWRSHIKTGSGSDIAAETFTLNGMNIEIRHGLTTNETGVVGALESKRSDARLVITGHGHSIREVVNANAEVVQGPTMQAKEPFGKVIYQPLPQDNALTGYLQMEVRVKDGEVVEHKFEPRLKGQLGVDDALFMEFLRDKKAMKVKA